MRSESISESARKLSRVAANLIQKRSKGSYLFMSQSLGQIQAIENAGKNIKKIKNKKRHWITVGYYAPRTPYGAIFRDIFKLLSEERFKPVEEE